MSKRVVLLFSGQGAQKVGMGSDLKAASPAAASLLDDAAGILDFSPADVMANGPEDQLTRTSRCQPALYIHGLMCLKVLQEKIPDLTPVAAAGLSLGEFTAHAAAGTFGFADGLKIVHQRGKFMEEACQANPGTMAAVIGGTEEQVRGLAKESGVDVANLNSPGQIVLSGSVEGIDKVVAGAKAAGCRMAKKLPVAGAYHSSLMAPAQEKLLSVLAQASFATPSLPVVANYSATVEQGEAAIKNALAQQVTGSVRWVESIERLLEEGHTTFLELGPGGVLAGLMNRIRKGTEVIRCGTLEEIEAAAQKLA